MSGAAGSSGLEGQAAVPAGLATNSTCKVEESTLGGVKSRFPVAARADVTQDSVEPQRGEAGPLRIIGIAKSW